MTPAAYFMTGGAFAIVVAIVSVLAKLDERPHHYGPHAGDDCAWFVFRTAAMAALGVVAWPVMAPCLIAWVVAMRFLYKAL